MSLRRTLAPAALTVLGGAALVDAWQRRWVGDDAFISFRYARNWADGLGLVYNLGERVEGYTNFLWTIWIGLGLKLGLDPVLLSELSGVACFAGVLILLTATSARLRADGPLVPAAALGWAACFHARVYATSGLETALFTLLASAAVIGAGLAERPRHWALVGGLGVAAALTRPDGLLFLGLAGLAALADAVERRRLSGVLAAGAPGLVLLAYAAWKLSFYGDLRPNTYYAKSAWLPWWDQGLAYLGTWFESYWVLALGWPLAALAVLRGPSPALRRLGLLTAAAPALYLLYVARVGGGFMFGRFCVPVSPLLLLGIELGLRSLPALSARLPLAAAALAAAVLAAPRPDAERIGALGISDEWRQYPPELVRRSRELGAQLEVLLEGLEPSVVIYGYQAMLAYYAELPYVIEGVTGLTDAEIAHSPIGQRGRPGHEKKASPTYLQSRGVDLLFEFPLPLPPGGYTEIDLGPVRGRLITYDRALLGALAARGARFTDFEALLDGYIAEIDEVPLGDLAADYAAFKGYYFDHNDDPNREAPFLERLP